MKKLFMLIAIIFNSFISIITVPVQLTLFRNQKGRNVFLLSDIHHKLKNANSENYIKKFSDTLLKQSNINVLYESPQIDNKFIKDMIDVSKNYNNLINASNIKDDFLEKLEKFLNINLPNQSKSVEIRSFLPHVAQALFNIIGTLPLLNHPNVIVDEKYQKALEQMHAVSFSLNDILTEVKKTINKAKKINQKIKNKEIKGKFKLDINQFQTAFDDSIEKFLNLFSNYTSISMDDVKNMPFKDLVESILPKKNVIEKFQNVPMEELLVLAQATSKEHFALMLKSKSSNYDEKALHELYQMYSLEKERASCFLVLNQILVYLIEKAAFLLDINVYQNLEKNNSSNNIVFAGLMHTHNLSDLLQNSGYDVIYQSPLIWGGKEVNYNDFMSLLIKAQAKITQSLLVDLNNKDKKIKFEDLMSRNVDFNAKALDINKFNVKTKQTVVRCNYFVSICGQIVLFIKSKTAWLFK